MGNVHAFVVHRPDKRMDYNKRWVMALEHDKWDFLLNVCDLSHLLKKATRTRKKVSKASASTQSIRHTHERRDEPEEVEEKNVEETDIVEEVEELEDVGLGKPGCLEATQDPSLLKDEASDSECPSSYRCPSPQPLSPRSPTLSLPDFD